MSWTERAACVGADPRIFFPPHRPGRIGRDQYGPAREFCNRCEVSDECLAYALENERTQSREGMYGGTMPSERDALHRRPRRAA